MKKLHEKNLTFNESDEEVSEEIRKRYKYRELILKRKIKVPLKYAKKLIGPDTAYHLYTLMEKKNRKYDND